MYRLLLSSALVLSSATMALAQDPDARPNFGSTRLSAGFSPDPHSVDITAGGSIEPNSKMGSSCRGEIANAPDYVLDYDAGSLDLYIRARSDDDVTLLVMGPDGRWSCNDDADGLNPEVVYTNPRSGEYAIWVGTYGGGYSDATLAISELSSSGYGDEGSKDGRDVVDLYGTPTYGHVDLSAGFSPDPHETRLTAGGSIDASNVSSECRGNIARDPDVRLSYDAGSLPLYIRTDSSTDTTLVVNDSNGNWSCNDDGGEGLNAEVVFNNPDSGTYDIWVGTYGEDTASATLQISELSHSTSTPTGWTPDYSEGPSFGTYRLQAGFTPDPHDVRVTAGGTHSASTVGSSCRGEIANAPDVRLHWDGGPITIKAEASRDITLVINDPNGNWVCDDDSGDGLNPLLRLNGSGQYDIWVGTYGGGSGIPATVSFTEFD